MRKRGQGLGDRLLLMPPGSTQSSPSPTLSSSCDGLPARVHRTKQVTHKEKWARLGKTPVVVVVVAVVAVVAAVAAVAAAAGRMATMKTKLVFRTNDSRPGPTCI